MSVAVLAYRERDFAAVKALWRRVFPDDPPWNSADEAIPAKLAVQPELFLVAADDGEIIGTVMAGYDGHRGWLYALAVDEKFRRRGIGGMLVREAEIGLKALGCKKINLQIRASNSEVQRFYEGLGYGAEERISMGKRLAG